MNEIPRRPIPPRPVIVKEPVQPQVQPVEKTEKPPKQKSKLFYTLFMCGGIFLAVAGVALLVLAIFL